MEAAASDGASSQAVDLRAQPGAVGTEPVRERLEESDAGTGFQPAVAGENLARERNARSFAAAREQILAQLDQARRALLGGLAAVARALDQRAAALRDGLQHVAEKGGVHGTPNLFASDR